MSERTAVQPAKSSGSSPSVDEIPGSSSGGRLALAAWLPPLLVILATVSFSLHFFYSRGLTDLYGDAIAHMEGARRLFDSATPGIEEIGSVWLPLFHLLAAPLAINNYLWRTGLAGSLISCAAFAITAWLLFRLAVAMNGNLAAGWVALLGFLACANMLYVASTPLTEPLCIMFAVLVVWALFRFQQTGTLGALTAAAVAAFFGTLTRYDGWYLLPFACLFVFVARPRSWLDRFKDAALFGIIAGSGPALWMLHNWLRFGNPLDFYSGPYSAVAIYKHQLAMTGFRYPTDGSYVLSARYYIECMKLVIGPASLELALLGLIAWAADARWLARRSAAPLLLVPLVFYVQSMAHASVPIYVPTLFPHTYYNLRYGLEMLPAAALFPSFVVSARLPSRWRTAITLAVAAVLAVQFGFAVRRGADEIGMVKESLLNTPCKTNVNRALTGLLKRSYHGGTVLLASGKYPCLLPAVGVPYRDSITELNRRYWRQLRLGPAHWPLGWPLGTLTWIIRTDGDPVDNLMRTDPDAFADFALVESYDFSGEEPVRVYERQTQAPPMARAAPKQ